MDLDIVNASCVVAVHDNGSPRKGAEQGRLDLLPDAVVCIRRGLIASVGPATEAFAQAGGPAAEQLDARRGTVLPGLVECHSHPLFAGHRHDEYAERLGGASLAEVATGWRHLEQRGGHPRRRR